MAKNKQHKRQNNNAAAKRADKQPIKKKQKTKPTHEPSDSDSDSFPQNLTPDKLYKLLEPYSKDQLIDLISNFSVADSSLYNRICSAADSDVTHKKIFVHGLSWDSTRETLIEAFQQYGQIEECSAVLDRSTGKCKGYGFVLFKTRKGAAKALEQPSKMIKNRMTHCQLASLGATAQSAGADNLARKIYVANVHGDVDKEKLRDFFAKFGEIEAGPVGFDVNTGKSRGYALFVYRREEDARKVLEEPYKMFEGRQLHCQKASDGKKNKDAMDASMVQQQAPLVSPLFSGMPGAPNMMFNPQQYAALHPFYGGMFMGPAGIPSPMLAAGMLNPGLMSSPSPMGAVAGQGGFRPSSQGLGNLGGSPSVFGIYGSSMPPFGLPQAYPQLHQPASSKPNGSTSGHSLRK
ncbi:hypothetical protein QQ045_017095 [Rhodiola kirilowii]